MDINIFSFNKFIKSDDHQFNYSFLMSKSFKTTTEKVVIDEKSQSDFKNMSKENECRS